MITKVEVRNVLGQLLTLELDNVDDGYVVEDIQGLDPVKATIASSTYAQQDGAQYQSSRREARNLLFILGLEPDYFGTTVQSLRSNLYRFFMPKAEVSLRFFMSDDLVVDIEGRVESFVSALFTKEPRITISIICFDPDFVDTDTVTVTGETVDDTTEFEINYFGTVETGILFTLNVDRTLGEFTIYHRSEGDVIKTFDFQASLLADDVLTINTVAGSRGVSLLRDSITSSLLYGKSPQSKWIELAQGVNYLRVYAEGAAVPFTIDYTPRYGGL